MNKKYNLKCEFCLEIVTMEKDSKNRQRRTCSSKCSRGIVLKNCDRKQRSLKISISRIGDKNPMWKGDKVGYHALHDWIKSRLPIPNKCQICFKKSKLDLSNKSDLYKRNLNDWEYLCRRCHMKKDGRLDKFINYSKLNEN